MRSQFATSSWGGRRTVPLAFTEHGAIMAATVLNSARAVEMSVYVVRAFVQFRAALSSNQELARKLLVLERHVAAKFGQHDRVLAELVSAIRALMQPPQPKRRPIGFTANLG